MSQTKPSTDWDRVLALYEEGASDVEIAKELGVTKASFDKMYAEVPAFTAFVDKGRTLSQAWWMTTLRSNLMNKEFNTSLFNFAMKNRFGWADKVETTSQDGENLNVDQLRTEFKALVAKLEKSDPSLARTLVSIEGGKAS